MTDNKPNKFLTVLYSIGYILVIGGTLMHIAEFEWSWCVFSVGALATIVGRALTLPSGNFAVRRLNMILLMGALGLVASAYFMYVGSNSWAVTLTISAFIDLYTSFRLGKITEKR